MTVPLGAQADLSFDVTAADSASALGSGDLPVLATPRLLAWCEAATVEVVRPHLGATETSVGTRVQLEHTRPSPIGGSVKVRAQLTSADGRLLRFAVAAEHPDGVAVAHAQVTRVVVDRERFLTRL